MCPHHPGIACSRISDQSPMKISMPQTRPTRYWTQTVSLKAFWRCVVFNDWSATTSCSEQTGVSPNDIRLTEASSLPNYLLISPRHWHVSLPRGSSLGYALNITGTGAVSAPPAFIPCICIYAALLSLYKTTIKNQGKQMDGLSLCKTRRRQKKRKKSMQYTLHVSLRHKEALQVGNHESYPNAANSRELRDHTKPVAFKQTWRSNQSLPLANSVSPHCRNFPASLHWIPYPRKFTLTINAEGKFCGRLLKTTACKQVMKRKET